MKPHLVLIPGAWHSGECFDTLLPYLKKAGYETTALTLPSVGAEPPVTSLDPDVEHIRRSIIPLLDDGKEVVVVMHSYGGQAGTGSLRGLSKPEREKNGEGGGVLGLVYLTAWLLPEGQSIRAYGGGRGGKKGMGVMREEVRWCGVMLKVVV